MTTSVVLISIRSLQNKRLETTLGSRSTDSPGRSRDDSVMARRLCRRSPGCLATSG